MKKNVIAFLSLFLFSINTYAGLLVEPLVGFNYSNGFDVKGGEDYTSGGGLGYGGRLGYQTGGFQIGGDYLNSSIDMTNSDFDKNIDTQEWGAFVGFEFPVLFRVYGEYIFSATGETKIESLKRDLKDGTGFKLGVGFTLIPFIDINVDYRNISFKNEDFQSFMVGLSLPLNLF